MTKHNEIFTAAAGLGTIVFAWDFINAQTLTNLFISIIGTAICMIATAYFWGK